MTLAMPKPIPSYVSEYMNVAHWQNISLIQMCNLSETFVS